MMIRILIIFFLILTIMFCDQNPLQPKKKKGVPPIVGLIGYLGVFSWGTKEDGVVVDNKDGTLTYTYKFIQTNPYFGNKVLSERTILIRRCLIGQVYRTTQNDCQGTGTKDTVWGASQLQWCPTNDRSCEKDGIADSTLSPAAKACAMDSFAGKKWRLVSKDDGLRAIYDYNKTNNYIYQDWENSFGSKLIWSREAKSLDKVFYPFNLTEQLGKTSFLNTLCSGDIS